MRQHVVVPPVRSELRSNRSTLSNRLAATGLLHMQWFGNFKACSQVRCNLLHTSEVCFAQGVQDMRIGIKGAWASTLAILLSTTASPGNAATSGSKYLETSSDISVTGNVVLLSTTVTTNASTWLYVQSDGRYYPGPPDAKALGNAYILVNGELVSNESIIDWRQSNAKQQHSFNVIGAKLVPAGVHTVQLVGASLGSSVLFGAESNLSVLVGAATSVTNSKTLTDSSIFNFNTVNVPEGVPIPAQGRATLLSTNVAGQGSVVAMASGRAYVQGNYGDAMWGIFKNGGEPNIDSMTWSINDLYTGAETQAPLYSQALFTGAVSSVQLIASESPYFVPQDQQTNNVSYAQAQTRVS